MVLALRNLGRLTYIYFHYSPYLSAGVISARSCVRATMALLKIDVVDAGRTTGVGRWVQELAWRDFYTNVLVSFPRVSMGRPYLEKFSDVVWENHQAPGDSADADGSGDGEMLQKWKEGKTGFPIVDAGMRCIKEMGWVHNRLRMITAMFLTKDLMMDWRVGERVSIAFDLLKFFVVLICMEAFHGAAHRW